MRYSHDEWLDKQAADYWSSGSEPEQELCTYCDLPATMIHDQEPLCASCKQEEDAENQM
ncbi:hypothetical protein [Rufibacter roseus]|uniref:DksA C4-type domain-containing protein n=1 Tax=Rufibacter roseus TaxID=1567108 RepID=A0ABW2DNX8_9BACT|nr:hypothetical protein [Rufibacter roseus]